MRIADQNHRGPSAGTSHSFNQPSVAIDSPLWGAELDHLRLETDDMERMLTFYRDGFGMAAARLGDGSLLLQGPGRRVVLGPGEPGAQPYSGFRLPDLDRLNAYRAHLVGQGINLMPSPSPVFREDAFAIADPDGRLVTFGLPRDDLSDPGASALPGRLQHLVVATAGLPAMLRFYGEKLGFVATDHVLQGDGPDRTLTAAFFRSTPEHHSFAVFRSDTARPDHHSYEVGCWNDIRDWADHLADLHVKLWWGPGRHGPGNNLLHERLLGESVGLILDALTALVAHDVLLI